MSHDIFLQIEKLKGNKNIEFNKTYTCSYLYQKIDTFTII